MLRAWTTVFAIALAGCSLSHAHSPTDDAGMRSSADAGLRRTTLDANLPSAGPCYEVRPIGAYASSGSALSPLPGRPLTLPLLLTTGCSCLEETPCLVRVDREQHRIELSTSICAGPEDVECECGPPLSTQCELPPLEEGEWTLFSHGKELHTLRVYPNDDGDGDPRPYAVEFGEAPACGDRYAESRMASDATQICVFTDGQVRRLRLSGGRCSTCMTNLGCGVQGGFSRPDGMMEGTIQALRGEEGCFESCDALSCRSASQTCLLPELYEGTHLLRLESRSASVRVEVSAEGFVTGPPCEADDM